MVEITLQFETEQQFERELRGVIEVIATADDNALDDGNYTDVMLDTAQQAELAYENQVLGWFLNGERIIDTTQH